MTSPALRAGFAPVVQQRTPWQVDPTFIPADLDPDTRKLYDLVRRQEPHKAPDNVAAALMGNAMVRDPSTVVETYTNNFHETGDVWFRDGVAQLMEGYYHYFQGRGRDASGKPLDPTKYREFTYDLIIKKNAAGEEYFAGVRTPGKTTAQAYLNAQKKSWWPYDQGLRLIPTRESGALGFRKPIYWRPNTSDASDLSTVGTSIEHGLDYTQWLSMMCQAVLLFAHTRDIPRQDGGAVTIDELYRELWSVIQEQWEMIAFRKVTFYDEYGVYKLGSPIVHSFLSTGNAHAYTNELYRLETGQEHELHKRAAETLYGWWWNEVFWVDAPNGFPIVQWPHQNMKARAVFFNKHLLEGPHLSRYNAEIAPELMKAYRLGVPGFDDGFMGAAANLVSQTIYHPLLKRGDKTVGRISYQIDGAGRFMDGTPFTTPLNKSKTIIDSETASAADRVTFRRNVGGLLVAFDPTPDKENLRRYTEYADAFVAKRAELATSRHENAGDYAVSALYGALRNRGQA